MISNSLANLKVLIVDDEKTMLKLVKDLLISFGFKHILTANNGRDAIHILKKERFDFIITDWRMEDLDGIGLVQYVRQLNDSSSSRLPIIMVTGNTEADQVITARDAGINAYLIKPFSADQLVRRIRAIIENPREFVVSGRFIGPDRRHKRGRPPGEKERRRYRNKPPL